jgi:hypothetical protein
MDEVDQQLDSAASSFLPVKRNLDDVRRRAAKRRRHAKMAALAIGSLGTVTTILVVSLAFAGSREYRPMASQLPPASQSASKSSSVTSTWSSSTPFTPQPRGGSLPVTFPDGGRVSISMSDWSGMEEIVPFAAVYPVGGCGGSVLFGWKGLAEGVVDPATESKLEPPAESAAVFQGRGSWQPYYLALSTDQWTALIPCSTSDSSSAVASAQRIAENVTLDVVDGWPILSATNPVELSSSSDEGGAPSVTLRFEPKTYLQLKPIPACIEKGARESAGVYEWCVSDADSGIAILATAEGADSVVRRLISDLRMGAAP